MATDVKSGKEILDDFFAGLEELQGVDRSIASAVKDLYKEGKLSNSNIENKLAELREQKADDHSKED